MTHETDFDRKPALSNNYLQGPLRPVWIVMRSIWGASESAGGSNSRGLNSAMYSQVCSLIASTSARRFRPWIFTSNEAENQQNGSIGISGGSRESCAKPAWPMERAGFELPRPVIVKVDF